MNDKKQIFAWAMYDWANSAFVTTVTVAVLPIYFADVVVGEEGAVLFGSFFRATTLWAWMLGASAFITFLFAPILGAIADYSRSLKKFLMVFCYIGCLSSLGLFFCGSGDIWLTMILFIIAQIGFVGGNVFYDAFLPLIASNEKLNWVSGKGFAFGYIGGGIQFALALGLITAHSYFGISASLAARLAMVTASLWWGGFSIVTFTILKEPAFEAPSPHKSTSGFIPRIFTNTAIGIRRTIVTAKHVGKLHHLLLFLVAYMIYNDGIQTVITMATIYGRLEMGLSQSDLMLTLLIIQFVAFFGSLLFGKIGEKISAKKALIITLVIWSFVVIYAYFMTTAKEYYFLGIIVGISMGGSQALSRSLYGSMIPVNASAEFYGFYSIFNKFSAIWGPLVFGIIDKVTGSARQAIISLIVFFIVGFILLACVNVKKASAAKNIPLFNNHQ